MSKKLGRNEPCYCGSGKKFKHCHGSIKSITKDDKTILSISDRIVVSQLRDAIPRINASFDKLFENEIHRISEEMKQVAQILFPLLPPFGDNDPHRLSKTQQVCLPLLFNAQDSILAALELLRNGHRLQPGILIRNVLETLSTVVYLQQRPTEIPRFMNDQLDSQKTIGEAKKTIPILGLLWGFFSEHFSHLGEPHRTLNPLVPFEKKDGITKTNLSFIRVSISLLYIVSELIFSGRILKPRFWKKTASGVIKYNPNQDEQIRLKEFLKLEDIEEGFEY